MRRHRKLFGPVYSVATTIPYCATAGEGSPRGYGRDRTCRAFAPDLQSGAPPLRRHSRVAGGGCALANPDPSCMSYNPIGAPETRRDLGHCTPITECVGIERFELPVSCSQSRCPDQVRLYPETGRVSPAGLLLLLRPWILRVTRARWRGWRRVRGWTRWVRHALAPVDVLTLAENYKRLRY